MLQLKPLSCSYSSGPRARTRTLQGNRRRGAYRCIYGINKPIPISESILIIGGFVTGQGETTEVLSFDPTSEKIAPWKGGGLTVARSGAVAGAFNGSIVVAGGVDDADDWTKWTELFHSRSGKFVEGPSMEMERNSPAGAVIGG